MEILIGDFLVVDLLVVGGLLPLVEGLIEVRLGFVVLEDFKVL